MKKLILISFISLSACTTAPKTTEKALDLREPAQADELESQTNIRALFETVKTPEYTYETPLTWDEFSAIEQKNFVCLDLDKYGRIFTSDEIFQRRNRKFRVLSYVRCKALPDGPVEQQLEDVKAKELMRNGL